MKLGMAYLPEDRKAEGIIADLSVRENIIIALQAKRGMFHPLSKKEMEDAADKYIKLLQIKTASRETPIKSLSGGNQQKVILGRWLLTNPDYLILDEPTDHLDMESITALNNGMIKFPGVLLFSSRDHQIVETTANRIMEIVNGKLIDKITTYDEYLANDEMARKRQVFTVTDSEEEDD